AGRRLQLQSRFRTRCKSRRRLHRFHLLRYPNRFRIQDKEPLLSSAFSEFPLLGWRFASRSFRILSDPASSRSKEYRDRNAPSLASKAVRKDGMHKARIPAVIFASLMFSITTLVAQTPQSSSNDETVPASSGKFSQVKPGTADPRIVAALRQVSPQRLRVTVEKLVSFVNRSTLSANNEKMTGQGLGVVNAAKWI